MIMFSVLNFFFINAIFHKRIFFKQENNGIGSFLVSWVSERCLQLSTFWKRIQFGSGYIYFNVLCCSVPYCTVLYFLFVKHYRYRYVRRKKKFQSQTGVPPNIPEARGQPHRVRVSGPLLLACCSRSSLPEVKAKGELLAHLTTTTHISSLLCGERS